MGSGDERMNPSNPAKFGAAFAAGLVVALAGAMIYVKTSGPHVQQATVAPAVQQVKQPESLNAAKPEEPVAAPAPAKPENPPVVEPQPKSPPPTAAAPTERKWADSRPAVRRTKPPVSQVRYVSHGATESQSTIRVEVSQIKPATEPVPYQSQTPAPVPSAAPVPTLSEDQPRYTPPPAAPQPHTVTLTAGTSLVVRLGETLSTDHNYNGDTFRATLDRPVVLDGFIIAEKGSKVLGKIVGVDKAGKFEGTSNLQLALTEINTTDGQRVRVQTSFVNRKGASGNGSEIAKVGGGAALGAIIGAVAGGGKGAAIGAGTGGAIGAGAVMLGKGRPAVIPSETQLTFQLSTPTTITEHLN